MGTEQPLPLASLYSESEPFSSSQADWQPSVSRSVSSEDWIACRKDSALRLASTNFASKAPSSTSSLRSSEPRLAMRAATSRQIETVSPRMATRGETSVARQAGKKHARAVMLARIAAEYKNGAALST